MERAAIFVDAGYYYAQGSYAAFGETLKRHFLVSAEAVFLRELEGAVRDLLPTGCEILRTYWYDGAQGGAPTPNQLVIGALPRVKLRLGRINSQGQQKGVDTLIVRDLMVLSQERSITHAFVLSGDEDLREGVAYAQDRGVVVGLLGIRGSRGTSQSSELAREADIIDERATQAAIASLARAVQPEVTVAAPVVDFVGAIDDVVKRWIDAATTTEIAALLSAKPNIPKDIDGQLLRAVSQGALGGRLLEEDEKRAVRRGFWERIGPKS